MYTGLAVCEGHYHPAQFNYIVYQASSGGLSCPESDQRISYYGITGFPTMVIDGQEHLVGAPADDITGERYMGYIDDHLMDSVPLAVAVTDWDFTPGSAFAEVTVKMFGDLTSTASTYIRVAIIESHVLYGGTYYDHVCRDMLPGSTGTSLTAQYNGEEQTVSFPFTNPGWNPDNMQVIAWVQRDTDEFIYNSGNSAVGPYAVMVGVDGPRQQVAQGGAVVFGNTNIVNVGTSPDTFDITLDTSYLPAGWDGYFTYDGQDLTQTTIALDPFTSDDLYVTINAGAVGSGRVVLNIYSQGAGEIVESLDFVALAGGTELLVVADDGGAGYAYDYVGPAITPAGKTWAVWDRSLAPLDGTTMSGYEAIVWATGDMTQTLDEDDRAAIDEYLGGGGAIFLTGQNIAQDLQDQGGSARLWFQFKTRCRFLGANSGQTNIYGEPGDPIGDGLDFAIAGGDGANNQTSPDYFEGLTADAMPVFHYGSVAGQWGGSRIEIDGYKLVFFGFGFEGISTQTDRNAVMGEVLAWLAGGPIAVEDTPAVTALRQNHPNPFNPQTEISFALDQSGPARLEVFNVQGQLVRVLVDGSLPAGPHAVVWDGRNDAGQSAASGTYFYRLIANDEHLTKKMTMVK